MTVIIIRDKMCSVDLRFSPYNFFQYYTMKNAGMPIQLILIITVFVFFFQVILRNGKTELELYLITLKLYRHQSNSARQVANPWTAPVGSVASSYGILKLHYLL